jgi:hypothetical protein
MVLKSILDKAKDLKEQANEAGKDSAENALNGILTELQGLRPILAKCGFSMSSINVAVSIPPDVTLTLKHDREAVMSLEEYEDSSELTTFQSMIVKSLKQAYNFSGLFEKFGYNISTISIAIALIPKISVTLQSVN